MRILYDGRIFQMQRAGGISRYFSEIISGLPTEYCPVLTGVEDFGEYTTRHPNLRLQCFNLFRPNRLSIGMRDLWWKRRLLRNVDLFHPTYYDLTSGINLCDIKCPMILTAYDFIFAIYPELMLRAGSEKVIRDQHDAIKKSNFVVCISKATEDDLLERFPEMEGRTTVIHLGSSFEVQPPQNQQKILENPCFLFVGGRSAYKNFSFLLRAFAKVCQSHRCIRLRIVGAPLNTQELWEIHLLGIGERVDAFDYPSEAKLKELYRSSVALVYPSLHEGFGIPPLEAMACRTLAITSNTSSLPEVMGDYGIMLDPTREEDWVDCMLEIANGGGQRDWMIEQGVKRVQLFTWKRTVDQHLEVYRRLAS